MLLVTGACGYIGSHFVCHYLSQTDEDVVAVDNFSMGHRQSLTPWQGRIRFYDHDIADREALARLMKENQVSAVVHFAANAYVGESQVLPFKYLDNNVGGSTGLLQAMAEAGVKRLVFSSTCATYGKPQYLPIDEKHPQKPINTYGSSKLMVEEMLRALALSKGLKFACLRYFNAAGASDSGEIGESHEPETHLIPLALMAALGKIPKLKVYGDDYDTPDGTCIRDYIHVLDLAAAHCQALDLLKRPDFVGDMEESDGLGIAVNLGTASGASVKEVIAQVEAVLDKPVPYQIEARRPGDPSRLVADNSKARRVLAWNPRYDLKRIIETAAQWELARRY